MNDQFRSLQSYIKLTRDRFEKAETLEEKRELLAISREIVSEAQHQIAEFRARVSTPRHEPGGTKIILFLAGMDSVGKTADS
jgi:hypothetical protein